MTLVAEEWVLPPGSLILGSTGQGKSHDADRLRELIGELRRSDFFSRSVTLAAAPTEAALDEVYQEAKAADWDGYGAKAVGPAVYAWAKRFISMLPTTTPPAEVSADPDGEISVLWRKGPWRVLSVSVGPDGRLSYAGLFGGRAKSHGTEYLGAELPKAISDNLRRLVSETAA